MADRTYLVELQVTRPYYTYVTVPEDATDEDILYAARQETEESNGANLHWNSFFGLDTPQMKRRDIRFASIVEEVRNENSVYNGAEEATTYAT